MFVIRKLVNDEMRLPWSFRLQRPESRRSTNVKFVARHDVEFFLRRLLSLLESFVLIRLSEQN